MNFVHEAHTNELLITPSIEIGGAFSLSTGGSVTVLSLSFRLFEFLCGRLTPFQAWPNGKALLSGLRTWQRLWVRVPSPYARPEHLHSIILTHMNTGRFGTLYNV